MQQKTTLIAAAITASLVMGATNANAAEAYGKLHLSFGQTKVDDPSVPTDATSMQFKSHASRFGVKDSKKLDNGMEVKGQVEFEIDAMGDTTKSSTDLLKARNTFIGLKGGFGEARLGIHDTPYKIATAKLDPFADTYADYNNIISNDNRGSNVIAYLNEFGPVGVALAYSAGADDANAGEENEADITSAMVNYTGGPLYLTVAVENFAADNAAALNELETATKFGAGYAIGPVDLGLVYETLAYETADDIKETYASLKFKASDAVYIKAAYGMRDDGVSATDDEVMSAVGLDYKLDKSATLYALYANGTDGGLSHKGKLDGDATAFVLGAIYKF